MSGVSTQLDTTTSALQNSRIVWVVAAITSLLFVIGNLPWQLDDYDQAKQAFTSFEMIKEGHWFYQQTPHERVATKPPLIAWMSAGLFTMTRSWEVAWRLPSLLAAIVLALVLFRAASSAYGSIAGLVAFSAFGLNLLSPRLATLVRTDMPLALVIFLIGSLIWQKIQKQEVWTPRDRVYLFALLTASMLIKGPIAYAFLLPGILAFQMWRRRYGSGASTHAWSGLWPWIASLAVFLVWVAGGILYQPGFFDEVVMREFLGRFGETIHRPQPIYFYLPHLIHKFAPWSLLLIAIAIFDLVSRRWRITDATRQMDAATLWLLCWSIGGLILMSLIPSKRVDRIYPVIPPLCLLLGACLHGRVEAFGQRKSTAALRLDRWIAIALVFAVLFTGGYITWKVTTGIRDRRDALVTFGREARHEAEMRHWRYEVVSTKDEGILLYCRKTRYIRPAQAVAEWNAGTLDALVASNDKAAVIMPQLQTGTFYQLKSIEQKKGEATGYVLIARRNVKS